MSDELVTINDVARLLGRSVFRVGAYRRDLGLPAVCIGGRHYYRVADVEAWRRRPEIAARLARGDVIARRAPEAAAV